MLLVDPILHAGMWLLVFGALLAYAYQRPVSTLAVGAIASGPLVLSPELATTPIGAIAAGVAVGLVVCVARKVHAIRRVKHARAEFPYARVIRH